MFLAQCMCQLTGLILEVEKTRPCENVGRFENSNVNINKGIFSVDFNNFMNRILCQSVVQNES